MSNLPTGIVTLLFTDVEGSTRLLHELGDGYGEVLHEHRRRLRAAFADHEGVEVDTQGDAFFVAFDWCIMLCPATSHDRTYSPSVIDLGWRNRDPGVRARGRLAEAGTDDLAPDAGSPELVTACGFLQNTSHALQCWSTDEDKESMMRVVVSEFISLDGVVQAPGGPQEDISGRFRFSAAERELEISVVGLQIYDCYESAHRGTDHSF